MGELEHRKELTYLLCQAAELEELAVFGAALQPAEGRDVVLGVSAALEQIAAELMTQVEAV